MNYELYEIFDNIGNQYYYTSINKDIEKNGKTYIATQIWRSGLEFDNLEKDILSMQVAYNVLPFKNLLNLSKDLFKIKITNQSNHTLFFGTISNVNFDVDNGLINVVCSSITKLLECNIPKKRFTSLCNNDLYDQECTLNKELFKIIVNVDNYEIINNRTIKINQNLDDSILNGQIIFNNQKNMIMKIENINNYTLVTLFFNLIIDNNINNDNQLYIYKGCDKNHNTCSKRFNNINNFNGFPSVPDQNYFYKF